MGLKEVLSRLKLVELSEPATKRPGAGAPRPAEPPLDELLAATPPPPPIDERALAAASGGEEALEIPDFASIYRAAGIAEPAHGFTALKVHEMLASAELAPLAPDAKAAALAGFLKMNPGGPVALGEIIQDAVRRDQALDRFAAFLAARLGERRAAVERENAGLQKEIDELTRRHRATMEENQKQLGALASRIEAWGAAKRAEEQRLHDAVAPFVEKPPITIDPSAGGSRDA